MGQQSPMNNESEQFTARNRQLEIKIASQRRVFVSLRDPNWVSDRIKKGETKAVGLRTDDDLQREDFLTWSNNLRRVGKIIVNLREVLLPRSYQELVEINKQVGIKPEPVQFGFMAESLAEPKGDFSYIRNLLPVDDYLRTVSGEKRRMIEGFINSSETAKLLTIACQFSPNDGYDKQEFDNSFVGAIFEQMAYQYLRSSYEGTAQALLSPQETLIIYQHAFTFTDRQLTNNNFSLNPSIEGIAIPDGLVIRETQQALVVESLVEYKTWQQVTPAHRSVETQIKHSKNYLAKNIKLAGPDIINPLYLGTLIHTLRPNLSAKPLSVVKNPEVLLALPENSKVSIPETRRVSIPIDSRALHDVVTAFRQEAKNGNGKKS